MNGNWNKIMTAPVTPAVTVIAKNITAVKMAFLALVWIAALYIGFGKLAGFSSMPPSKLAEWLLCGLLGSAAICSFQLLLSMVIRSFAIPVGIALLGGIAGLAAIAKGFPNFWPYSLFAYGMRANNPDMEFGLVGFIISVVSFTVIFITVTVLIIENRDVKA